MFRYSVSAAVLALLCSPAMAQDAIATLTGADDEPAGLVVMRQARHGVVITAELQNLSPGWHGFHIHETGDCGDGFSAAGGHLAPDGREHGYAAADGYHAGDLPNLHVADDGTVMAEVFTDRFSVTEGGEASVFDTDGAAVMIHEKADIYGDEAEAGSRIACGIILPN